MSRPSQVIVIAEDDRTHRFVWAFLKRLHYATRQYQPRRLPRGCGEQFVRDQFAREVKAVRKRPASTVLIAVVDADNLRVEERFRQLSDAFETDGVPARRPAEPIAILIPKRNIETWILSLTDNTVNEAEDYKPRPGSSRDTQIARSITQAAEAFHDITRKNARMPPHIVESLKRAVPEAQRVPRAI